MLARRHPSPIWHENKWDVHFDRAWPAFYALQLLLKRLNAYLPRYAELADAYREERDKGHHTRKWLITQTRRYKRDNTQRANRVKRPARRDEDDRADA